MPRKAETKAVTAPKMPKTARIPRTANFAVQEWIAKIAVEQAAIRGCSFQDVLRHWVFTMASTEFPDRVPKPAVR